MGFLQTIGDSIAAYLKPIIEAKATELINTAEEAIRSEIRAHMPLIIEAVVKAVATTATHIATEGVDKFTGLLPDDLQKAIDPIIKNVLGDILGGFRLQNPAGEPVQDVAHGPQ